MCLGAGPKQETTSVTKRTRLRRSYWKGQWRLRWGRSAVVLVQADRQNDLHVCSTENPNHERASRVTYVRLGRPGDDRYRDEKIAIIREGFIAGHSALLSDSERSALADPDSHPDPQYSWSQLPAEKQFAFAFDGDRLVGVLILHFAKEGGSFAVVEPMHIASGYRSSGLGRRLWNVGVEFARSQHATSIHVWAMDGNVGAIRFYREKIGCKAVGKGEWRIGDHVEPATEFQYDL